MKRTASLLFLLFTSVLALSENIRGLVINEIHIQTAADFTQTVGISLEEMSAVFIQGNTQFLEGLKIELHLSNTLKKYSDSFGLAIYKGVSPEPGKGKKSFTGSEIFFHQIPYMNRIYIFVPVNGLEVYTPASGTFYVDEAVSTAEFPLLISMIPLMKGIPNSVIDKKFFLTFTPILDKKGLLELDLQFPKGAEDEPVKILLDGNEIGTPEKPLEMVSGVHQLRIESSAFKEVNASFTIESGKTNTVEIIFEEILSELSIEAPKSAEVFLDGEKLNSFAGSKFPLKEGDHIIRIKLDDYSLSKKFSSKRGKDYHLSIVFDIIINED